MRPIWVIYKNPTDFPHVAFVMRQHVIDNGKVVATEKTWQSSRLAGVRCQIPKGKIKMERSEQDEPQIVEWWY